MVNKGKKEFLWGENLPEGKFMLSKRGSEPHRNRRFLAEPETKFPCRTLGFPRKGQTEVVNMTLFLLIAIILLFSVFIWGNSVIGSNAEEAKLFASEQFMRNLDSKITNVVKNGGSETMLKRPSTNLMMVQGNIIEYIFQGKADVPQEWVYITGDDTAEVNISEPSSVIRERKDGDNIKIQLYYRNRTGTNKFLILPHVYFEGLGRNTIKIESNGSSVVGDLVLNSVKLTV